MRTAAIEVENFGRFVIFNSGDLNAPFPFYAAGKGTKDVLMDEQDNVICARTIQELKTKLCVL